MRHGARVPNTQSVCADVFRKGGLATRLICTILQVDVHRLRNAPSNSISYLGYSEGTKEANGTNNDCRRCLRLGKGGFLHEACRVKQRGKLFFERVKLRSCCIILHFNNKRRRAAGEGSEHDALSAGSQRRI